MNTRFEVMSGAECRGLSLVNSPAISLNLAIFAGVALQALVVTGSAWSEDSARRIQTVSLTVTPALEDDRSSPSTFSGLLKLLLLESMKSDYVDLRHWNGAVERFDGFRIHGTRISKREREVPHGFWRRYRVHLIQPEKTFDVQVEQLEPNASGSIPFSLLVSLRARCEATFVWWAYGVKGLNGTTVSDATLQLRLQLETSPKIGFGMDTPLPRVELRPRVSQVELKLKDLDVRQIGILKGDLAEILGDGSRKAVEALMQQQEGKIRSRLQKELGESAP